MDKQVVGVSLPKQHVMLQGLEKAVELLSKYAAELNYIDGGNRRSYTSVGEFLSSIKSE